MYEQGIFTILSTDHAAISYEQRDKYVRDSEELSTFHADQLLSKSTPDLQAEIASLKVAMRRVKVYDSLAYSFSYS